MPPCDAAPRTWADRADRVQIQLPLASLADVETAARHELPHECVRYLHLLLDDPSSKARNFSGWTARHVEQLGTPAHLLLLSNNQAGGRRDRSMVCDASFELNSPNCVPRSRQLCKTIECGRSNRITALTSDPTFIACNCGRVCIFRKSGRPVKPQIHHSI